MSLTVLDVVRGGWARCPDATRAGLLTGLRDYDFTETLRGITAPTTVICGDVDQVTPLAESERMAEAIEGARLEVVPGAGHAVFWEAADLVAELIAQHAMGEPSATAANSELRIENEGQRPGGRPA